MRMLSGHTKPFAVLGHPIGHTLSPIMHNAAFKKLGRDAIYLAFDVHPDKLMSVLASMADMGFAGANLTVPLKEVAFRHLDQLDESARLVGAVNTVAFTPDGIKGYNTDGDGFLRAVQDAFGQGVQGRRIFVMGAGGAGRAVALVTARDGAAGITLADIDAKRVEAVAEDIRKQFPSVSVQSLHDRNEVNTQAREADLIVQATTVGMKENDPSVLSVEAFRKGQHAFDLIYMYPQTNFMKSAVAAGAEAANGLGMLLHQGARAFEIWTDVEPPVDVMRAALEQAVYRT